MKYKLIDVIGKTEEDVEFGTCEVCQYIGTNYYDILVFEDKEGYFMYNDFEEENKGS